MIKSTLLARIRRKLYENTADLWQDVDLYDFVQEELSSLYAKNVYKEELYTTSTVVNQIDYQLPVNTYKVDRVEFNEGTSTVPDWDTQAGWDTYGTTLYLQVAPTEVKSMRLHLRMPYGDLPSLASADIDIPDSRVEVVVLGAVLRAYQSLMGYFVDLKNWDYNAKPDGISMSQVQGWIRDVKQDYLDVLKTLRRVPVPRFIDLVD